ncbi:MAG: hypothetical protein IAE80_29860 [Anaerolinea sp.]|nr:hypothetical protein [Anaerolinea sp.]
MARKSLVQLIAVIALLSFGVLVVAAQDDQPNTPPFGYGMMGGMHNGMGRGHGMMWGATDMPGMTAVAEVLGMEPAALIETLQAGQTLAQIAETQGVELQTVYDAMLTAAQTHMADLVVAGTLTQAEADEHLTYVQDHLAEMPMFSGADCAVMGAMQGMGHMGSMHGMGGTVGHGHGTMGGHHG